MQNFYEDAKTEKPEKSKAGLTGWLKSKFLGKAQSISPVDTKFLEDLQDIKKIGRYEITGKLGRGSMGIVYQGRDPYIKRDVSIKVSRPAADVVGEVADHYRERFFLEESAAGLSNSG